MKRLDCIARPLLITGACAVLGSAACSGPEQQALSENPVTAEPLEVVVPVSPAADSLNLEQMIEFAKSDLAQRLGIDPGSITVVEARAVTWRSGAVGCPQPGMMYTQALEPGYRVVLQADETKYSFHSGQAGTSAYCPPEREERPLLSD